MFSMRICTWRRPTSNGMSDLLLSSTLFHRQSVRLKYNLSAGFAGLFNQCRNIWKGGIKRKHINKKRGTRTAPLFETECVFHLHSANSLLKLHFSSVCLRLLSFLPDKSRGYPISSTADLIWSVDTTFASCRAAIFNERWASRFTLRGSPFVAWNTASNAGASNSSICVPASSSRCCR